MRMRNILLASSVIMLLFLLIFWETGWIAEEQQPPISVLISTDGEKEEITCWKDEDGRIYAFLPSYADTGNVSIRTALEVPVMLDGVRIEDVNFAELLRNKEYELSWKGLGGEYVYPFILMQSSQIATVYIETESGSMDYIHVKKGNEETGRIRLYTAEGKIEYSGEIKEINGRGNATWTISEKKPYSMTLAAEADLLGMGKAQRWIFLANAYDESHMRNKIAYDFSDEVGLEYSPDSEWIDLYLNGEYAGLYLLCERNEVHHERVDIGLEGSFLVSLESEERLKAQNYPYVLTDAKQAMRIHYPDSVNDEKKAYIADVMQSVENALLSESGVDVETGKHWTELIDLDSWAMMYLMEELFARNDAFCLSQYFYCDGGENSVVYAGPVWDYDISLGNSANWMFTYPRAFYANRLYVNGILETPWIHRLYTQEEFLDRVIELYATEYLPLVSKYIDEVIPKYEQQIFESTEMNGIRWEREKKSGEEIKEIISFLSERVKFLSSAWLEEETYCRVSADVTNGNFYAYFSVSPGECLAVLPELEDMDHQAFVGWYYADTDELFDEAKPIYEDTEIYAKWEETGRKKLGQLLKLVPLSGIAFLCVGFLVIDVRRRRKDG